MTMAASLGTGFLKTETHLDTPDIQFHIQPFSAVRPPNARGERGLVSTEFLFRRGITPRGVFCLRR